MTMIQMESNGACQRMGAPARQEVTFADGSALWLHCVVEIDSPYHRRVELANGSQALIDLRTLAPDLTFALPGATTRDTSFAVFHSLRKHFRGVQQLREAIGGPLQ
jgi:hypothetical protein